MTESLPFKQKYITYYRVSTDKQGIRGLGIQSQQEIVENYVLKNNGEIINSYVEVASGKKSINRVQLNSALKECKRNKATLIVAKLDRLSRNVHFISGLQESKVKFLAIDCPEVDETMILIYAVFAQHERRKISERTKAALAILKSRGVKLGNPQLKLLNQKKKISSIDYCRSLYSIISDLKKNGYSQRAIASNLTNFNVKTPAGFNKWTQTQVYRVMKILGKKLLLPVLNS